MPLAAITPVLNDLLNKDGGNSSSYPSHRDSSDTGDYLRKTSIISNQVLTSPAIDDVSIFY
jgi:hypothetical protein